MTIATAANRIAPMSFPARAALRVLGVGLVLVGSLVSVILVAFLGYWALALPLYIGLTAWAVISPGKFAAFLFLAVLAIEPGAIDATQPLSKVLYEGSPAIQKMLPIIISPAELLLLLTLGSS